MTMVFVEQPLALPGSANNIIVELFSGGTQYNQVNNPI